MEILKKIIFGISNWKKLVKIEVDFNLLTKSGNKICIESHDIEKPNFMVVNYSELSYFKYIKQINEEYKNKLNKLASAILTEFQKKKRRILNRGVLDSGDYIVKCSWEVTPEFESISYKEYKKWKLKNGKLHNPI